MVRKGLRSRGLVSFTSFELCTAPPEFDILTHCVVVSKGPCTDPIEFDMLTRYVAVAFGPCTAPMEF